MNNTNKKQKPTISQFEWSIPNIGFATSPPYAHVNIFWVKTRLKRGWVASKTQRTNASQVKHSTRPDAVQLRNAFARVLVLNASRRDFFSNRVSGETFHASRRVQNKILIIWKININPSQIRTELPSTLFLDGLGLPWRTDWILP
jgi:hypothetical protein